MIIYIERNKNRNWKRALVNGKRALTTSFKKQKRQKKKIYRKRKRQVHNKTS